MQAKTTDLLREVRSHNAQVLRKVNLNQKIRDTIHRMYEETWEKMHKDYINRRIPIQGGADTGSDTWKIENTEERSKLLRKLERLADIGDKYQARINLAKSCMLYVYDEGIDYLDVIEYEQKKGLWRYEEYHACR